MVDPAANDSVTYEIEGDCAQIALNRPDRLNAVTPELYEGIEDSLTQSNEDEARVVVIEGNGRAFCVGADMQNHNQKERTPEERRNYVWNAQEACKAVQTHSMPVIAKIHGYAIGAGAELALSADFVFMADDAEMRFPEASIGTYVGGGITYTLADRIGRARAKELILASASLTGREAAEQSVVTNAVPSSELDEAVENLSSKLASNAPIPMKIAKEQFGDSEGKTREEMLSAEAEALLTCMNTEDWKEGVDAFDEDREPQFKGV